MRNVSSFFFLLPASVGAVGVTLNDCGGGARGVGVSPTEDPGARVPERALRFRFSHGRLHLILRHKAKRGFRHVDVNYHQLNEFPLELN